MTRYCLGPACRDLTPVRGPRSLYCAACWRVVKAQHTGKWQRGKGRSSSRAAALRWYRTNRERAILRRKLWTVRAA